MGQTKNRHRSDEEWIVLIEDCKASSMSTAEWCRRNDIKIPTLYAVMKRLKAEGFEIPAKRKLDPAVHNRNKGGVAKRNDYHDEMIIRADGDKADNDSCAIEIQMGKVRVKVNNGTDPALLSEMMNILKKEA